MIVPVRILSPFLFLLFLPVASFAANNYIDNLNGTITETASGTMWMQSDDGVERMWSDAQQYCEQLETAGYSDWFLPKIHQLEGLIDSGYSPTIDPLFKVKPSYYWSSSESRNSVKSAKYVNFYYGNTYAYSKDNTYYVLCARDATQVQQIELSAAITPKSVKGMPFKISFAPTVNGGSEPFFYEWDFGDGEFSSLADPEHNFAGKGPYKVILTVSDTDGAIAVDIKEVVLPLAEEDLLQDAVKEGAVGGDAPVAVEDAVKGQVLSQETTPALASIPAESVAAAAAPQADAAVQESLEAPVTGVPEGVNEGASPEAPASSISEQAVDRAFDTVVAAADTIAASGEPAEMVAEPLAMEESVPVTPVPAQEEGQESDVVAESGPPDSAEVQVSEQRPSPVPSELSAPAADAVGAANIEGNQSDAGIADSIGQVESGVASTALESEAATALPQIEPSAEPSSSSEPQEESGASAASMTEEPAALLPHNGVRAHFQAFANGPGKTVGAAASGEGLLAYSFANALKGDADWNKDGRVTAHELKGYLALAVENVSQGGQQPVIELAGDDFALCADPGKTFVLALGVPGKMGGVAGQPSPLLGAEVVRGAVSERCLTTRTSILVGERASRSETLQALQTIKEMISPADNLIVYYSGQGKEDRGRMSLFFSDTDEELYSFTGLFFDDIASFVEKMDLGNVVMLVELPAI